MWTFNNSNTQYFNITKVNSVKDINKCNVSIGKTAARKSATTVTIKGLTKGKTYYFKVRAVRTVDNKNVYSYCSKAVKTKIK